jgi:hypothetical protein
MVSIEFSLYICYNLFTQKESKNTNAVTRLQEGRQEWLIGHRMKGIGK